MRTDDIIASNCLNSADVHNMNPLCQNMRDWKRSSQKHFSILGNMNPASAVTWTFNFLKDQER